MVPSLPDALASVLKFWTTPELLVIPTPLTVSLSVGVMVTVKGVRCASGVNTMLFTSVLAETEMFEMEDDSKVAVSNGLSGTMAGDHLSGVFQFPLTGEVNQVALPANADPAMKKMSMLAAKKIVGRRGERCFSNNVFVA